MYVVKLSGEDCSGSGGKVNRETSSRIHYAKSFPSPFFSNKCASEIRHAGLVCREIDLLSESFVEKVQRRCL